MADNVTLNAGSGGAVVATDDIGAIHYQLVKLVWGALDTANIVADVAGKRVPVDLGYDGSITLQASQVSAVTNTTTSRTTTTGLGIYTDAVILINISGGGAATGTLQLFLEDSCDGGSTWNDLVASNTFTFGASTTTQRFYLMGRLATSGTQGGAQAIESLTSGTVRLGPWGDRIRVREKVSGTSGTPTGPTYSISAVFKR